MLCQADRDIERKKRRCRDAFWREVVGVLGFEVDTGVVGDGEVGGREGAFFGGDEIAGLDSGQNPGVRTDDGAWGGGAIST